MTARRFLAAMVVACSVLVIGSVMAMSALRGPAAATGYGCGAVVITMLLAGWAAAQEAGDQ